MFQHVNPGLARRFQLDHAFHFSDFSDEELMQVLEMKLEQQGLSASPEAKRVAADVLRRTRMKKSFGNAGEVENLIGSAKVRCQKRIMNGGYVNGGDVIFLPEDFDPGWQRASEILSVRNLFADIIGMDDLIIRLEGYQKMTVNARKKNINLLTHDLLPTSFLFLGPSGTGKTTIASRFGTVFYNLGFLSSPTLHTHSASDFHTPQTTRTIFEKSLGSVLFIDEAYRLTTSPEIINEIVDLLTQSRFKSKLVLILAGYEDEMKRMMRVNPGLGSRVREKVMFGGLTGGLAVEVLKREVESKGVHCEEVCRMEEVRRGLEELGQLKGWGNGRDLKTLAGKCVGRVLMRDDGGGLRWDEVREEMDKLGKDIRGREERG